jgi:predicted metal-dependent peptidase
MAKRKSKIEAPPEEKSYLRRAPFREVPLDAQQREQWDATLSATTWIGPGFINVLYTMMESSSKLKEHALFTEAVQFPAATDGIQLIIRPSMYFRYHILERSFINFHEVLHQLLNHCRAAYAFRKAGKITFGGKTLPWDDTWANIVQDYVINAVLVASKMGRLPKGCLYDPKIATENDNWVETYFRHWKDKGKIIPPPQDGPEEGQPCDDGDRQPRQGQFDGHLDPGESLGAEPAEHAERNEQMWEVATNTAMEIQRAHGKLPGALERFFQNLLTPKVDWTEHIKGMIVRMLGAGSYDWRRLDRRLIVRGIGAPGITGHGARLVVVGGDTSMSVFADGRLVNRFLAEIGGMLSEVNPEEVRVLWIDTEVRRVDILEDVEDLMAVMYKGVPGGGGTSFVPLFDYIRDNMLEPDCVIYLTDLAGDFPKDVPAYPVIWGSIAGPSVGAPFGEVVHIPPDTQ